MGDLMLADLMLVSLQPALRQADLADGQALERRLDGLLARALQARRGEPAVAVLPEYLGVFAALGQIPGAARASTPMGAILGAWRPLLARLPQSLLRGPRRAVELVWYAIEPQAVGAYHHMCQKLARRHQVYLVAGSVWSTWRYPHGGWGRGEPRGVFQTVPVYSPQGELVQVVRKHHLMPGGERDWGLRPGPAEAGRDQAGGWGMSVLVCLDAFTQSHTRRLTYQPLWRQADAPGVKVLLQPAGNPLPWQEPWPFAPPGTSMTQAQAWDAYGPRAILAQARYLRVAATSHLVLDGWGMRFEGESRIFCRRRGEVEVVARAGAWAPEQGDAFAAHCLSAGWEEEQEEAKSAHGELRGKGPDGAAAQAEKP
jgi:predicted amidohydrolase